MPTEGSNGKYRMSTDQATVMMHMEASQMTMAGLADMLSQFARVANPGGCSVVDMTGLKGSYNLKFDFSLSELMTTIRAQAAGGGGETGGVPAAYDPGSGASIFHAVAALGLKLEPRKAPVEQLIIGHVERTPTEN